MKYLVGLVPAVGIITVGTIDIHSIGDDFNVSVKQEGLEAKFDISNPGYRDHCLRNYDIMVRIVQVEGMKYADHGDGYEFDYDSADLLYRAPIWNGDGSRAAPTVGELMLQSGVLVEDGDKILVSEEYKSIVSEEEVERRRKEESNVIFVDPNEGGPIGLFYTVVRMGGRFLKQVNEEDDHLRLYIARVDLPLIARELEESRLQVVEEEDSSFVFSWPCCIPSFRSSKAKEMREMYPDPTLGKNFL